MDHMRNFSLGKGFVEKYTPSAESALEIYCLTDLIYCKFAHSHYNIFITKKQTTSNNENTFK